MLFRGVDDIEVGRIPMPQVEVPTDAVLKVIVCGICGSDLHPLHGKEPCAVGTVFGHECVGEVVSTGSAISGFNIGDRYHVYLPYDQLQSTGHPCDYAIFTWTFH
jgi:threonine dehydrogenase-like Zn-dependent dehydrogenase